MKTLINGFLTTWSVVSRISVPVSFSPRYREFGLFLPITGFIVFLSIFSRYIPGLGSAVFVSRYR